MDMKKIILIVILYLTLLLQLREIVLHYRQYDVPNQLIPHRLYNHTLLPNLSKTYVEENPENTPIHFKHNSQGLRENHDIIIPKPNGIYRILIVGDSFIVGANEQISIILKKELEKAFSGREPIFEVINAGTSGYSSSLHLARLKHQHLSFSPDAIIYFPDLHDVEEDSIFYKNLIRYSEDGKVKRVIASTRMRVRMRKYMQFVKDYLDILGIWPSQDRNRLVAKRERGAGTKNKMEHSREDENNISEYTLQEVRFSLGFIDQYIQIAKSNGIHLAFAMYPHLYQIIPENEVFKSPFQKIHNRFFEKNIKMLAEKNGLAFRSFHEEIKSHVVAGEKIYWFNDIHFNDKGHALLGAYFSNWVLSDLEKSIGFVTKKP